MIKRAGLAAPIAALFFCVAMAAAASAQDGPPPSVEAIPQAQTSPHSYRLDYTLTELEDGKKIDVRQYSISVAGGIGQVKIDTKVPAGVNSDGGNQYLDVGTSIKCFVRMRDGAPALDTDLGVSSVVPDEGKVNGRPILRTFTISSQTPVVVGKGVMVGTVDDPNSKRKFQLEVMAAEIK